MKPFARLLRGAGWLAGLVALVSQLALGTLAPPNAGAADARDAVALVAVLCSGLPAPADHRPAHPAPRLLAVCPPGAALGLPAVLLWTPVAVPPPRSGWGVARPFGRAPPASLTVAVRAASPRGPPSLT